MIALIKFFEEELIPNFTTKNLFNSNNYIIIFNEKIK